MSAALQPLPDEGPNVVVVLMLTPSRAVDLFLGDLQRRSRSKSGRTAASYSRLLDKFVTQLERRGDLDVGEITSDDCRTFLNAYARKSPGYQAVIYSTLNSFLEWLYVNQRIKRNPLDFITRPRRTPAADLDVVTVSTADVPRLLAACDTWPERLALSILAYLGPRRNAVALLRLSDYDRERRMIRFREKGSKVIWKPVPDELAQILDAAIACGVYESGAGPDGDTTGAGARNTRPTLDPYLVPPEGPLIRSGDRDDRCIWRIVKRVADGIGVDCHVHALRAAFAVHYMETHDGDLVGLQELLGHSSIETTRIYLRKLDKQRAMEPVRKLTWAPAGAEEFDPFQLVGSYREETIESPANDGELFASSPVVGAGGFEPPNGETPHGDRRLHEPELTAPDEPRKQAVSEAAE